MSQCLDVLKRSDMKNKNEVKECIISKFNLLVKDINDTAQLISNKCESNKNDKREPTSQKQKVQVRKHSALETIPESEEGMSEPLNEEQPLFSLTNKRDRKAYRKGVMSLPNTPWLPAEHERFVKGLEMHGK